MKAKLTKMNKPRISRNQDVIFHRLHFQVFTDEHEFVGHAMTDLVSGFRNFANWKAVIDAGIGTWIKGVELMAPGKINADSRVMIIQAPVLNTGQQEVDLDQIKVRSHSDPDVQYKIVKTDMGWECSCPGFVFRKDCKHIREAISNG